MRFRIAAIAVCLAGFALPISSAGAAAPPVWTMRLTALPANLAPGGQAELLAAATNLGGAPTTSPSQIELTLPAALTPTAVEAQNQTTNQPATCHTVGRLVSCETTEPVGAGRRFKVKVTTAVALGALAPQTASAAVSGGGALEASASTSPPVQAGPLDFGFVAPGLTAPLTEEDGTAATLAGSHPYQQTVTFGFPTEQPPGGDLITNAGHPHEIVVSLPPGLLVDPAATPVLCTEAELESSSCPDASQVGLFELTTIEGQAGVIGIDATDFYNMVPPPGAPAELGANVEELGIFLHLIGGVRSDGDYGIEARTPDVIALGTSPFFEIQSQLWGDPSSSVHDHLRGTCIRSGASCPVASSPTAFITLPGHCTSSPDLTAVRADSWERPGAFVEASYEGADLSAGKVSGVGCSGLSFAPTIEARPTTDLADSPSGLDVDLHQPQDLGKSTRSPAELRDARVTLPAGMAVNPSQAAGLAACTSAQIGLTTPVGASPAHFSRLPQSCPEASRIGTVEVTTPLLARRDAQQHLEIDPETGRPKPLALPGSVYLAAPFDNPFHSLLALYLAVEDPATGIVAKLAGRIEPDPATGRLTTTFSDNPQLPLEDVRLHLYPGARGALITPPTCGTHTTATTLTPWSSPEGAAAHPESSFQTTAAPGGGACPTTEGAAPNSPSFTAGTLTPQAGAFSPFVLKLSREDGSQRLTAIDTTLAPGLIGKLAGIAECPAAQIAQAEGRSRPEEGILERESPSCPASTEVGTVTVGAGAGPTPFYTQGHAYLAGPYKGAPVSLVTIVPAIAGPFDLGTVVTRVALHVEPETAQIHAVSDPLPTILDGIPLDLRSIALKMDRPQFTLNPTSCDPLSITGQATSALGQAAPLTTPFQVGGCSGLKFAPKLALSLKGATKRAKNPALKAVLTYPQGNYANIASAQVTLPHSEFLDQTHIQTVCTRVQFAARACPAASIYGRASATTPLLDQPLSGPVYLRSSSHPLPDLVADLNGQIEVTLDGKVDTGKGGGIRNTFEAVPDAPVSKFVLEMQGGKKGLLVNSENICRKPQRAIADFTGQNGKVADFNPLIKNSCKGGGRKKKGSGHKKGKGKQGPKAAKRPLDSALLGHPLGGW